MQKVRMLKSLLGVRAGEIYPTMFEAGKEYEINDSLVLGFMEQGGCELVGLDPEERETKVTGPDETKPAKPLNKMSKAELVSHGMAQGLELVPDNMTAKEMIAAIEAHATKAEEAAAGAE